MKDVTNFRSRLMGDLRKGSPSAATGAGSPQHALVTARHSSAPEPEKPERMGRASEWSQADAILGAFP